MNLSDALYFLGGCLVGASALAILARYLHQRAMFQHAEHLKQSNREHYVRGLHDRTKREREAKLREREAKLLEHHNL